MNKVLSKTMLQRQRFAPALEIPDSFKSVYGFLRLPADLWPARGISVDKNVLDSKRYQSCQISALSNATSSPSGAHRHVVLELSRPEEPSQEERYTGDGACLACATP